MFLLHFQKKYDLYIFLNLCQIINNTLKVNHDGRISISPPGQGKPTPYQLNVQGDINLNGQFFQNNQEFVTSRWTEASNNLDIYRLSRVGIKKQDPTYDLHVLGGVNLSLIHI